MSHKSDGRHFPDIYILNAENYKIHNEMSLITYIPIVNKVFHSRFTCGHNVDLISKNHWLYPICIKRLDLDNSLIMGYLAKDFGLQNK